MTLPLLSEEQEQIAFVNWIEIKGIKFSAIPNSTYTKSWSVKNRNTRTGVRAGLPDLLIALPHKGLLFIEMKRVKRGVVSEAQKSWIEVLNTIPGVEAVVCLGCEAAIACVSEHIGDSISTTPLPSKGVALKTNNDTF